jgi:hypothetical protein
LLVTRRVGDDKGARLRRKIAIGDINRDALLALRLESVNEQREIDFLSDGAVLLGILLQRRQLIVENQLAFIEQTPDQRRLSVVDGTAGKKAQSWA